MLQRPSRKLPWRVNHSILPCPVYSLWAPLNSMTSAAAPSTLGTTTVAILLIAGFFPCIAAPHCNAQLEELRSSGSCASDLQVLQSILSKIFHSLTLHAYVDFVTSLALTTAHALKHQKRTTFVRAGHMRCIPLSDRTCR